MKEIDKVEIKMDELEEKERQDWIEYRNAVSDNKVKVKMISRNTSTY